MGVPDFFGVSSIPTVYWFLFYFTLVVYIDFFHETSLFLLDCSSGGRVFPWCYIFPVSAHLGPRY